MTKQYQQTVGAVLYQVGNQEDAVEAVVLAGQYGECVVRLVDTDVDEYYGYVFFDTLEAAIAYADKCMAPTGSVSFIV